MIDAEYSFQRTTTVIQQYSIGGCVPADIYLGVVIDRNSNDSSQNVKVINKL
jgi:hypothetical protein